jgi:DNA-directed RNA polymerase subunit RPC12/RpoP
MLCKSCGRISEPEHKLKGHVAITIILLLFWIIPGLIYMIWRRTGIKDTCSVCGSNNIIPTGSPEAIKIIEQREQEDSLVKCPQCRELILPDAIKCKHCGSLLTPQ